MNTEDYVSLVKDLVPVVIAGAGAFLLSLILFWFLRFLFKRINIPNRPLNRIQKPVSLIIILGAVSVSSNIIFESLSAGWNQAFEVTFILTVSWLLTRIVAIGRDSLMTQYNIDAKDNLKARKVYTQIKVFERIVNVVIVVVAIALSLMTFDTIRSIGTSILASAGIAGIIVGVAAQKLLANLLAGFQIAITQPIRIDDVVIMENEWGRIEEITLTYVVVRIWDQRRLIVPATQVIEKPFQNWTRINSDILGTVFMYVDYRMPVDELRKELTSILENTPLWDKKVNVLQVTNLTEKTMELRALMSAKDSPTAWDLRVHVREQLILFLQEKYPEHLPKSRVELDEKE